MVLLVSLIKEAFEDWVSSSVFPLQQYPISPCFRI
jgi:hypothetical protein